MRRITLTAARRSKNLKEHEEAFKSVNGVAPTPIPEEGTEISGIIATIMVQDTVTRTAVNKGARQIRDLSERKINYTRAGRMIYEAMGYKDCQDAQKQNGNNEIFNNLNFDRKDLAKIVSEIDEKRVNGINQSLTVLRPYFEALLPLPSEEVFAQVENHLSKDDFHTLAREYSSRLNLDYTRTEWRYFFLALAWRYRNTLNHHIRKEMGNMRWIAGRYEVNEAAELLANELFPVASKPTQIDNDL